MEVNQPKTANCQNDNHLSPPISRTHSMNTKHTLLTLPPSPMSPQRSFSASPPPFHQNEYPQFCSQNLNSGTQGHYSLQQKKKANKNIKRTHTFNCVPVHSPAKYTNSCPGLSTKAKIMKKKLSIDSVYSYDNGSSERQLAPYNSTGPECVANSTYSCCQYASPNKFRYKKSSMIETQKELNHQRQFHRIPSVVIWLESSQDDDTNNEESDDSQEIHTRHRPQHNNTMSNLNTTIEYRV